MNKKFVYIKLNNSINEKRGFGYRSWRFRLTMFLFYLLGKTLNAELRFKTTRGKT